nr:unnamed protein product [Callosobruchus chinensis]
MVLAIYGMKHMAVKEVRKSELVFSSICRACLRLSSTSQHFQILVVVRIATSL